VLFMRFVIQARAPHACLVPAFSTLTSDTSTCRMRFHVRRSQVLAAAPRLRGYVLELLGDLVSRGIWAEPNQWRGWLMAAAQTAPDSFPAMLQVRLAAWVLAACVFVSLWLTS